MSCTSQQSNSKRRSWRNSLSSLFGGKKHATQQVQSKPLPPARIATRPHSTSVSRTQGMSRSQSVRTHRLSRASAPEKAEWDVLMSPATSTSSRQSMPPIPNKYRQSFVPPQEKDDNDAFYL